MIKKLIFFATNASCLLFADSDSLEKSFLNSKLSGDIRSIYMNQQFNLVNNQPKVNPNSNDSAFDIGGNIGLKTAKYNGISAGVKFYTSQLLASSAYLGGNPSNPTVEKANIAGSFLNTGTSPASSYSTLGQAFLEYSNNQNNLIVGRQEFNSPLLDMHDTYMIPNLFQGAVFKNRSFDSTIITLAYLNGMQAGTTGNSKATTNPQTSFNSLSAAAFGNYINQTTNNMGGTIGNQPLYIIGLNNNSLKNLDLQLWHYNNTDVLQAMFAEAKLGFDTTQTSKLNFHTHFYGFIGQGKTKTFFQNANLAYNSTAPNGYNLQPVAMNNINYNAISSRLSYQNNYGLTPEIAATFINAQNNSAFMPNIWGGYPNYAHSEYIYMSNLVSYAGLDSGANAKNSNQWRYTLSHDLNKFNLGKNSVSVAFSNYGFMKTQNNGLNFNTTTWDLIFEGHDIFIKNLYVKCYYENAQYATPAVWGGVQSFNLFKLKGIYSF